MGGLMKTVRIDAPNGAIAVHESAGEGPPVVLIHGHGESDDAKDPSTYSLPGHARAVWAVVNAFGLHEAWFVGWSLGGHVALEMAPDLPQARGLLIFGAPPL